MNLIAPTAHAVGYLLLLLRSLSRDDLFPLSFSFGRLITVPKPLLPQRLE